MVFKILFLSLTNSDWEFSTKKLTWGSYIAVKTLPTIKKIELINRCKFAQVILDKNIIKFVIHVDTLETPKLAMSIYPPQAPLLATLQ